MNKLFTLEADSNSDATTETDDFVCHKDQKEIQNTLFSSFLEDNYPYNKLKMADSRLL